MTWWDKIPVESERLFTPGLDLGHDDIPGVPWTPAGTIGDLRTLIGRPANTALRD